ncbi:LamG domain-containing protein [Candidatus Collierbacteria bacterium]|nr:LamG domain-containing protein [Candidatus Collierbacteria bacterium]
MKQKSRSKKSSLKISTKNRDSLLFILLLIIVLPLLLWTVYQQVRLQPKAYQGRKYSPFGNAVYFNNEGSNDSYTSTEKSPLLTQKPFTIEAWVKIPKPTSGTYVREYPLVLYTKPQTWVDYGYIFNLNIEVQEANGSSRPDFTALMADSTSNINTNYVSAWSTISVPSDTWYHVAATAWWENNLCSVNLYVNGVLAGSGSKWRENCHFSTQQPKNLWLARHPDGSGGISGYNFNGFIDEIRISSSVRYIQNFQPSMVPFENDLHTLLLYHLDENTGATSIKDSSSNNISSQIFGPHLSFSPSNVGTLPTPTPTPVPTCKPRPACLNAKPPCKIPDVGYCPFRVVPSRGITPAVTLPPSR